MVDVSGRQDGRQPSLSLVTVWPRDMPMQERNERLLEKVGWHFSTYPEEVPTEDSTETSAETDVNYIKSYSKLKLLRVDRIDLQETTNNASHHTDVYDLSGETNFDEPRPAQLIVRRGQPFYIDLHLQRSFASEVDDVNVVFEIGDNPKVSKGTQVTLPVRQTAGVVDWGVSVERSEGTVLTLKVATPPSCIVGCWRLHIDSLLRPALFTERSLHRYTHPQPVYILFNPWATADDVYMEDEVLRDEYVMNDVGKIFFGNYNQIGARFWIYAQFENFVLDCCIHLLNDTRLDWKVRGNAAEVVRGLCKLIVSTKSHPGLLEGNWSGDYSDGTAPCTWIGSSTILEQYWYTRRPVKFGQCWVFAALSTTICRALGIPCRPVTNYASGHNCDASLTMDFHWNLQKNSINEMNDDTIWSYHAWNEVWMRRPELPVDMWGWQAFDTTIQQGSRGMTSAGPCPVAAIKRGQLHTPHNTDRLFAELNADSVQWFLSPEGLWRTRIHKHRMGRLVVTKKPRMLESAVRRIGIVPLEMDILTNNYKNKIGSQEDRTAVHQANASCCQPGGYENDKPDVKFKICLPEDTNVGMALMVTVRAQNCNRELRNVHLSVAVYTSFYTGVLKALVLAKTTDLQLGSIKAEDTVIRISAEDYIYKMSDQSCFKLYLLATVKETNQIYAEQTDFRLSRPILTLEGPRHVEAFEQFHLMVNFRNPLPTTLTCCCWMMGGVDLQKIGRQPHKDLEAYEEVMFTLPLTAKCLGLHHFLINFYSREVMDICTLHVVNVVQAGSIVNDVQDKSNAVRDVSDNNSVGTTTAVSMAVAPGSVQRDVQDSSSHINWAATPFLTADVSASATKPRRRVPEVSHSASYSASHSAPSEGGDNPSSALLPAMSTAGEHVKSNTGFSSETTMSVTRD